MYLGSYRFEGDPDQLITRYEQLMTTYPVEALLFHVCVRTADGIEVLDACPTQSDFRAFAAGPEFHAALDAVGLPRPKSVEIGTIHSARTHAGVVPLAG